MACHLSGKVSTIKAFQRELKRSSSSLGERETRREGIQQLG